MNKEWLSISEAASMLGVSDSTLRLWDKRGKFIPERRLQGGKRLYSIAQIEKLMNVEENGQGF